MTGNFHGRVNHTATEDFLTGRHAQLLSLNDLPLWHTSHDPSICQFTIVRRARGQKTPLTRGQ
jgi:hypothetical protein